MARTGAAAKLVKYRSMRDFARTAEPSGDSRTAHDGHSFVVQQHAARRLHYDFRLELDGVLLSWAVPKGPSLSPKERRLAVRTEDHPLEYADFEGVIPEGQYGGGTVVVWDRGTWEPEGDGREALAKGRLTFTLHGEKLHGRWHLVKTRGDGTSDSWLLFKGRDEAANDQLDVVATQPTSVLSGRTLDEVAAARDREWHSDREVTALPASELAVPRRSQPRRAANVNEIHALLEQLPLGFPLTNLTKVLYPEQGITKGELIAYLAVVAEWALPHIANRPLTLVRCPEGLHGKPAPGKKRCFFQKKRLVGSPPAITAVPIAEDSGEAVDYMAIHDRAGLVALAQLGTLEIHTWGARADRPERPDLMVFDLDPDIGLGWERVALGAFELRRRLHDLGFESFVKTTGGKGLHVVAPILRTVGWDELKAFTKAVVDAMAHDERPYYTTNMAKARRKGKIFLDYLRNGRNATFIAPYSPRARAGAPVAVPISWDELAHGVDPARFTTATVPHRLATLRDDPWKAMPHIKQSISASTWRAVGGKRG